MLSAGHLIYQSHQLCLNFLFSDNQAVAEQTTREGLKTSYHVDISAISTQQAPDEVKTSAKKTVQWLLDHRFIPVIQGNEIFFSLQDQHARLHEQPTPSRSWIYARRPTQLVVNSSSHSLQEKEPLVLQDLRLHEAVVRQDVSAVMSLIQTDQLINCLDENQKSPLYLAAVSGHLEIISCLLKAKASFRFLQKTHLLHVVAFYGHTAVMQELLASPQVHLLLNEKDRQGRTPLHQALIGGPHFLVVSLLLKARAAAHDPDHQGYTPLHYASQKGCLQSVNLLLEQEPLAPKGKHRDELPLDLNFILNLFPRSHLLSKRVDLKGVTLWPESNNPIDALTLSKRTPLYLSAMQGHGEIIGSLLKAGASPLFVAHLKQSLLHVIACYGHHELLAQLLTDPKIKHLIHHQDQQGNTPLHLAVKHGRGDCVKQLMCHQALILTLNQQRHSSLALAHLQDCDEIIDALLGISWEDLKVSSDKDLLLFYNTHLLAAKQQQDVIKQVRILMKIHHHHLSRAQYLMEHNPLTGYQELLKAAHFLNTAVAVIENTPSTAVLQELRTILFQKMGAVEEAFVKSQGKKYVAKNHLIQGYRLRLKAYRKSCQSALNSPILASQNLTQQFAHLLKTWIRRAVLIFGPPPVKWAAICLGSMARREMCPYSDLDYGFLIENDSAEARLYFRRVLQFVNLCIINMGETPFKVFGEAEVSPTPQGFRSDALGENEVIGTPESFAHFQTVERMNENIIFTNALNSVAYLDGDPELVSQYEQMSHELRCASLNALSRPFHEILAIRLLEGGLSEFNPNYFKENELFNVFGIKKELYRPVQEIINGLALFFNIKEKNTLGRVDALVKMKLFSASGAKQIHQAFHDLLSLRFKAHLFYKSEEELTYQYESWQVPDLSKFILNDAEKQQLQSFYCFIMPFFNRVREFLLSYKKTALSQQSFFNSTTVLEVHQRYVKQQNLLLEQQFNERIKLHPHCVENLVTMRFPEDQTIDYEELLVKGQLALKSAQQQKPGIKREKKIVQSYSQMGFALYQLQRYEEAFRIYQNIEAAVVALKNETSLFSLSRVQYHLGDVSFRLKQSTEAVQYLESAIKSFDQALKLLYPDKERDDRKVFVHQEDLIDLYTSLGVVFEAIAKLGVVNAFFGPNFLEDISQMKELQDHPEVTKFKGMTKLGVFEKKDQLDLALVCYRQVLSLEQGMFGQDHLRVALTSQKIGDILYQQHQDKEGYMYYVRSEEIQRALFKNQGSFENLLAISTFEEREGDAAISLQKTQQALKIAEKGWGHLSKKKQLITCYARVGFALCRLERYQEALEIHHTIFKKFNELRKEGSLFSLSCIHSRLGLILLNLSRYEEASDHLKKALEYFTEGFIKINNETPENTTLIALHQRDLANIFSHLGLLYFNSNQLDLSYENYKKALEIQSLNPKFNYFEIGKTSGMIAAVLFSQGKWKEAMPYHLCGEKQLIALNGDRHPTLGAWLNATGDLLQDVCEWEQALTFHLRALDIFKGVYKDPHPDLIATYQHLKIVYSQLGNTQEVAKYRSKLHE
ncbi:MAG: tetratricopeptide repeat protein [Candidatus Rhabdochlamydia sp.]